MMKPAFFFTRAASGIAFVVVVLLCVRLEYQNFRALQLSRMTFTERAAAWDGKIAAAFTKRAADWDGDIAAHTHRGGHDEAIEKVDKIGVDAALGRADPMYKLQLGTGRNATRPARPQVAFIFLLESGMVHEPLWRRFFSEASNPNSYSIYVHQANPEATPTAFGDMSSRKEIPWTPSQWCALLGLEMVALQEALTDTDNQQFVFISESAVPLKSFDYVYKDLMRSSTSSKLCAAQDHDGASDCRFSAFKHKGGTDGQRGLVKHHQWIVLSREHVGVMLENARSATDENYRYRAVQAALRRDPSKVLERDIKLCSDESVPGVALLQHARDVGFHSGDTWTDLARIGVEQRCTTFVYWAGCLKDTRFQLKSDWHPATEEAAFHPYSWEEGLDGSWVQQLVHEPSLLFARKVPKNINVTFDHTESGKKPVTLHDFLPTVWDTIHFDAAAIVPIPSLSVAGLVHTGLNVEGNTYVATKQ
jgi:hypothetical protein